MAYIPEDQRDTSYYIFNKKFKATVKYLDTRSKDHIKLFGTPTSGIREIDTETARERILTYLTINQMVEFYKKGSVVGIVNSADTKVIYEHITDHLNAWKKQLQDGLNNGGAPIEDLMLLDRFANSVYEHARYQFTEEIVESLLLRQINSIMPLNKDSLISGFRKNNPVTEEEDKKIADRKPMEDFFATYQRGSTLKPDKWS